METILMKVKQMLRECCSKRFLKFSSGCNSVWHEKKLHALYRYSMWFIPILAEYVDHMMCLNVYVCVMESHPVFCMCVYVFVPLFIRQLLSKALCAVITLARKTAGPFIVSGAAVSVQPH